MPTRLVIGESPSDTVSLKLMLTSFDQIFDNEGGNGPKDKLQTKSFCMRTLICNLPNLDLEE